MTSTEKTKDIFATEYSESCIASPPPLFSDVVRKGLEDIIVILVGPNKVQYHVHGSFLVYHSGFFRNAFNGNWRESEDGITLLDVETVVFNIFVNWLYTMKLPGPNNYDWTTQPDPRIMGEAHKADMLQIKLYVFADRFMIPALRLAMNRIITADTTYTRPCANVMIFAFDNLRAEDVILQFLVDSHCLKWRHGLQSEHETRLLDQLSQDCLTKIMKRFGFMLAEGITRHSSLKMCDYHEHISDVERLACCK
ncbi:hypothetical protein K504DRAFT_533681 [Pleomassaria siparia CBS 279.74]|uniref:BTB domain-containing protein n=1 Tax=Pleomassaria siparia CBS 279.74 TaxID=1314801 RepID=A0A6G1K9J5_9PLEO|nr:hypothetical protein K504DRAFT_533681 [Pleomassaria siparia CBS 279.74]